MGVFVGEAETECLVSLLQMSEGLFCLRLTCYIVRGSDISNEQKNLRYIKTENMLFQIYLECEFRHITKNEKGDKTVQNLSHY